MEKIIIVEGDNKYKFINKNEVIQKFFGKDYHKLSEDEKYQKLRLRTLMNSTFKGIPVKDLMQGDNIKDINEQQYIILDEETFLLSLAKNNDIVIYEQENANEFAVDIDKSTLERVAKEYIRINDCVNEILKSKIKALKVEKNIKFKQSDEERT